MAIDPKRVLFVGQGSSAVCYYRCALPAMAIGADWVGLAGEPPRFSYQTGLVKNGTLKPDFTDYDVVVLQQPRGYNWNRMIELFQEAGTTVIFEIDDYLHGIPSQKKHHDFASHYTKDTLRAIDIAMAMSDGVIVSTQYLADRYRHRNPRIHVCENGLDMARYNLTLPEREGVNVVWAGGTGHREGLLPWLRALIAVMDKYEHVSFVSIGQEYADWLKPRFGPRAESVPWTLIDTYPAAMCHGDVAMAPAGRGLFFRGKSDLRWLEAGALRIPAIASPRVYPRIEEGVTGFHADDELEVRTQLELLVNDASLRLEVGANARRYVEDHRTIQTMSESWLAAFEHLRAGESAAAA